MSNKCAAYGCSSIYDSERKDIKMKKVKTTLRYSSVIRVQAMSAPMILGTGAPMILGTIAPITNPNPNP